MTSLCCQYHVAYCVGETVEIRVPCLEHRCLPYCRDPTDPDCKFATGTAEWNHSAVFKVDYSRDRVLVRCLVACSMFRSGCSPPRFSLLWIDGQDTAHLAPLGTHTDPSRVPLDGMSDFDYSFMHSDDYISCVTGTALVWTAAKHDQSVLRLTPVRDLLPGQHVVTGPLELSRNLRAVRTSEIRAESLPPSVHTAPISKIIATLQVPPHKRVIRPPGCGFLITRGHPVWLATDDRGSTSPQGRPTGYYRPDELWPDLVESIAQTSDSPGLYNLALCPAEPEEHRVLTSEGLWLATLGADVGPRLKAKCPHLDRSYGTGFLTTGPRD